MKTQEEADKYLPKLLEVKATVRFALCEPLMELVKLGRYLGAGMSVKKGERFKPHRGIDWVIVGGDIGSKAQPFNVEWAESLLQECHDRKRLCFVDRLGSAPYDPREAGPGDELHPDGPAYDPDCRLPLCSPNGDDPEDLDEKYVRQIPHGIL